MNSLFSLAVLFSALLGFIPKGYAAQSDDVIAVITELKFNKGDIQITAPGKSTPEKPGLLQSLYNGSRVQASKDATVTVLFTDGSNTVKVDDKNSPYEIKAAVRASPTSVRLKEAVSLLIGKTDGSNFVGVAARGKLREPTLLSPRGGKLLTTAPIFQWMGLDGQPSTVKVYGPQGVIWSADNISSTRIAYPSSAPPLKAGEGYSWSAERKGGAPEKANFTIAASSEIQSNQEQLAEIDRQSALSKTTAAVLKGNLLISRDLFHDGREVLIEAAKADPKEPTLRLLLAEVYDKTGLRSLAQEQFSEAQLLATKRP